MRPPARHLRCALLVITLTGLLLLPGSAQAASLGCADDSSGVSDLQSWVPGLLAATNEYRASKGLTTLQLDTALTKASLWKARDMARRNYFDHDDPANGSAPSRSPWERLSACGYNANAYKAENIAAGQQSAEATVQAWIKSPGHRANLENPKMRYVGFGVSTSTNSTYKRYMVQMFASLPGPASATPPSSNEPGTNPGTDPAGGEQGAERELRDVTLPARASKISARVTKSRCRAKRAVRGYCYSLVVRTTVRDTAGTALKGRRVTVTRRASNGRYRLVGRATTNARGVVTIRRSINPPARGTRTWLLRNARTTRVSVAKRGTSRGHTVRKRASIPR